MKVKWPGLIDVHVHLREPGAEYKEDFRTGSQAALAGGFSYILDMPNNPVPTVNRERLEEKIRLAKKAGCEIGFHFGTDGKNLSEFKKIWDRPEVFGLKVYLSVTTGNVLIEDRETAEKIFKAWESEKPILVHAEAAEKLGWALELGAKYKRRVHVCHVSLSEEVDLIRRVKDKGQKLSSGVTPHHLWLREGAMMKPPLNSESDKLALWQGLNDGTIDLVESDHAPHLKEENMFGVTGLETTLGLMLLGVKQGKCSLEQVKKWLHDNPKNIFKIPNQKAEIEFDPEKPWTVENKNLKTKCGWSPFSGWQLYGKVEKITYA